MRLFPNPNEGLHPALPVRPPPFERNRFLSHAGTAGFCGLVALSASLLSRRRPTLGLEVATVGFASCLGIDAVTTWRRRRGERSFLESKGIVPPAKGKWIERMGEFDNESVLLGAGLLGMLLRLGRFKPGSWAGRRMRVEAVSQKPNVWDVGSFCFGAAFGRLGLSLLPLPGTQEAKLQDWHDRMAAREWRGEIAWHLNHFDSWRPHVDGLGSQIMRFWEDLTLQLEGESLGIIVSLVPGPEHIPVGPIVDDQDAAPRSWFHSHRFQQADVNFPEEAEVLEVLQDQLRNLEAQRESYQPEAELLWHKLTAIENERAAAQNDPLRIENPLGKIIKDEGDDGFTRFVIIRIAHQTIWGLISETDWLIADTKKRIKRLEARQRGERWLPRLEEETSKKVPEHVLDYLLEDCKNHLMLAMSLSVRHGLMIDEFERVEKSMNPRDLEMMLSDIDASPSNAKLIYAKNARDFRSQLLNVVAQCTKVVDELSHGTIDAVAELNRRVSLEEARRSRQEEQRVSGGNDGWLEEDVAGEDWEE